MPIDKKLKTFCVKGSSKVGRVKARGGCGKRSVFFFLFSPLGAIKYFIYQWKG